MTHNTELQGESTNFTNDDISCLIYNAIPPDLWTDNSFLFFMKNSYPGMSIFGISASSVFVSVKHRISYFVVSSRNSGQVSLLLIPQTLTDSNFSDVFVCDGSLAVESELVQVASISIAGSAPWLAYCAAPPPPLSRTPCQAPLLLLFLKRGGVVIVCDPCPRP